MNARMRLPLAGCAGIIITAAGCVLHGPDRISRCWFDFNTHRAPAFYIDEVEHRTYRSHRVDHFRWMYNHGPGAAGGPRAEVVLPGQAVSQAKETRPPEEEGLVPLPPPENADGKPPAPPLPPPPSEPARPGDTRE